ncbi:SMI1/KNR4 family protein [Allosphingosinicella flava]|uniref:SMI1/KNR4 family protein n=1 Tax=Allosphingosinicella flava TaxID=2771430 RepID=A0A7T2LLE0_9SPHN|nr:SMI1/KNR4 family protein [Sphingosinicella flava]QPQ54278.1 SMI1/KNR4 family protein [Sphingosinicella flava]
MTESNYFSKWLGSLKKMNSLQPDQKALIDFAEGFAGAPLEGDMLTPAQIAGMFGGHAMDSGASDEVHGEGAAAVTEPQWRSLLQRMSDAAIADEDIRERLSLTQIKKRWLGEEPAPESAIAEAESRLGLRFPPSLRAFYKVSNGWRSPAWSISSILPVEEIVPFKQEHVEEIAVWSEGGDRHSRQIATTIQLSPYYKSTEEDDAVLLLNPLAMSSDDEMEVWFHASWVPGAAFYRSFWHLMTSLLKQLEEGGA